MKLKERNFIQQTKKEIEQKEEAEKVDISKQKEKVSEEKKQKVLEQIKEGFIFTPDKQDFKNFSIQFIALLMLGLGLLIPGIILLVQSWYALILITIGGFLVIYAFIRLVCFLTYRLEIHEEQLKWRNIWWWNIVPKRTIHSIVPKDGYFFYVVKIGGVIRSGIEVIKIEGSKQNYWVRAYPLRPEKGEELVTAIICWMGEELNWPEQ
ncbi:MAG: hypothetical protein GF308_02790 [Candidatus Heimdallarchaeota archaeon]|nr:hypothetical protein [Candidatus Heimdallarchaeota archaeon]